MWLPVVLAVNALYPTATLLSPVVIASKAIKPTATFLKASSVVDEGSLPKYVELSSTKASERPLIEVAADDQESVPLPSVFNT